MDRRLTCKILKNNCTPWVGLPLPRSNTHVYNHTIQSISSLNPFGQSKSTFIGSLYRKGGNVFINNPGRMIKIAAIPIYGKNPSKIISSGNGVYILLIVPRRYFCGGSFVLCLGVFNFFLCCWHLMYVFILATYWGT